MNLVSALSQSCRRHKYYMGRGKEESPRQDEEERNCGCPMSPMG